MPAGKSVQVKSTNEIWGMAIIVQSTVYSLQTLYGVVPGNSVADPRALSWEHGRKAGNAMHKKEVIDQLEYVAQQMMELAEGLKGTGGRPLTEDEMSLVKRAVVEKVETGFKELVSMYLGGVHSDILVESATDMIRYYTKFTEAYAPSPKTPK